jgi:hypothetical protein
MNPRILWALACVSLAAVGYETALTRYFAVSKWSEYGYWVISIVMAGFALSGVVLALTRDAMAKRGTALLSALPPLLVASAALGYRFTTTNPFNPLSLQNSVTWAQQVWLIGGYYAALLPFFFLAGLFVSLCFVMNDRAIGRVYAADLIGAGAGALLVLLLMFWLHPFMLVPAMLAPLAASAAFAPKWRLASLAASLLVLGGAELVLVGDNQATINDFKAIYAPSHTPDAKVLAEIRSPRGDYLLLDDFTERVDTDVSNNAGMLGLPGPPRSFGLYRDGNRVVSLPMPGKLDLGYAAAALDALPYTLIPHANALVVGASGGFRAAEPLTLGAAQVDVLEPEPVLRAAIAEGLGLSPPLSADPRRLLTAASPLAAVARGQYDVIDISADFMDASEANGNAFTAEAVTAYLQALKPGGLVSLPVSIRDFPVYALRVMATARAALLATGASDPASHVVVYRSAWNVRVLLSAAPWDAARIEALRKWCDDRSFDVSYYPGMDVEAARANLYNDLPTVSFTRGEVESQGSDDAIADEAKAVLDGLPTQSGDEFNLAPMTLDRPAFYSALRLAQLGTILKRLEVLPQAEIGALVNLAVLGQAIVLALLVLALPLVAGRRLAVRGVGLARAAVYFPALGLGFLFIEIVAIEKASLYLSDRTTAFALVLTGMLIFSGIGSLCAGAFAARPRLGAVLAAVVVVAWCGAIVAGLMPVLLGSLGAPFLLKALLVVLAVAPVSIALGVFFPLGLAQTGSGGFLPWAWGLNGAFSVVATPLANLLARQAGFDAVLISACVLYGIAAVAFPLAVPLISPSTKRSLV